MNLVKNSAGQSMLATIPKPKYAAIMVTIARSEETAFRVAVVRLGYSLAVPSVTIQRPRNAARASKNPVKRDLLAVERNDVPKQKPVRMTDIATEILVP